MTTNYQNLPTVQYQHTEVSMDDVIAYLQSLEFVAEVKRATYIIFRNESANGTAGINNNFIGLQTDGSRWPDGISAKIIGNVPKTENGTGHLRVFAAFASWKDSVDILVNRVIGRGLYIGGLAHPISNMKINGVEDFATAYDREWVTGKKNAVPPPALIANIKVMYSQAAGHFKA